MTRIQFIELLKLAASRWNDRNAPRLGAALAYYALLSVAPLVVLIVAICGVVFEDTAERQLVEQISAITGTAGASTVRMLLESAHHTNGVLATTIALVTLLFGASGVFVELRGSLNTIWDAPPQAFSWRDVIWQRLVSFATVVALGLFVVGSLFLSAALTILEKFFSGFVPLHLALFSEIANFLASLLVLSALFALIFKFVPDVAIAWRDVAIGAVATAVLFSLGKMLLGLYLGSVGVGSAYGAAGSLVALVVWVYYSSQIFFFGAVFTRVYADRLGSAAAKQERTEARRLSLLNSLRKFRKQ